METPDFSPRKAALNRRTDETLVQIDLNIDGSGSYENSTGIGFLDHMLSLFARHGQFDLSVRCDGDLHVDDHHTVEDIGITLGQAFREALGEKEFVGRYGHSYVPMDEALVRAVIDLSGRSAFRFDGSFTRERIGRFSTEMVSHFWQSFADQARCNLHISVLYGENDHHKIEAVFKSVARAMRVAAERHPSHAPMPSTKGTLS